MTKMNGKGVETKRKAKKNDYLSMEHTKVIQWNPIQLNDYCTDPMMMLLIAFLDKIR